MLPAARLTDMHVCPVVQGVVPHVGGPISVLCCPRVLIGGLPAARVTDQAICVGPPDSIMRGAATVLFGGLPAARLTDTTFHGGLIAVGNFTVLIGNPSVTFPYVLSGTPSEIEQMQQALAHLYATEDGREAINRTAATGRTITIKVTNGGSECRANNPGEVLPGGRGSDSTVYWNPSQTLPGLPAGDSRSGAVVLGHELIHGMHNAEASHGNGPYESHPGQVGSSSRGEERQTVGSAPPYDAGGNPVTDADGNPAGTHVRQPDGTYTPDTDHSDSSPTENGIRREMGFPDRGTYYPPTWTGGPPW